jgi:hypothetical protein
MHFGHSELVFGNFDKNSLLIRVVSGATSPSHIYTESLRCRRTRGCIMTACYCFYFRPSHFHGDLRVGLFDSDLGNGAVRLVDEVLVSRRLEPEPYYSVSHRSQFPPVLCRHFGSVLNTTTFHMAHIRNRNF